MNWEEAVWWGPIWLDVNPSRPGWTSAEQTTKPRLFAVGALLLTRRFPPPWAVEDTEACFIVRDHSALCAGG